MVGGWWLAVDGGGDGAKPVGVDGAPGLVQQTMQPHQTAFAPGLPCSCLSGGPEVGGKLYLGTPLVPLKAELGARLSG